MLGLAQQRAEVAFALDSRTPPSDIKDAIELARSQFPEFDGLQTERVRTALRHRLALIKAPRGQEKLRQWLSSFGKPFIIME